MKPAGNDIARDLRAKIKHLTEELQEARLRLNEVNGKALPRLEGFDLTLPQELSLEEIQTLLSRQEQRVLCCYLECPNDKAVARLTGKKLQTVRNQMASIERKLNARGRGEVIIQVLAAYFEKKLRNG